jgi:hypothetical protein
VILDAEFLKEVGELSCWESSSAGFKNWCNREKGEIRRGDYVMNAR